MYQIVTLPDYFEYIYVMGQRHYEQKSHLGDVVSTISDRRMAVDKYNYNTGTTHKAATVLGTCGTTIPVYLYVGSGGTKTTTSGTDDVADAWLAEVESYSDYYPFGMQMVDRFSVSDYRYGMNGQEHEDEITNNCSHYSAEYWMYDSRLGRRWNVDPVVKFHESPYASFSNNPIIFIDPLGADTIRFTESSWTQKQRCGDCDPYSGTNYNLSVTVADGRDVFYYIKNVSNYDSDAKLENYESSETEFYPIENDKSGITTTPYALGLLRYRDDDRTTLGKLAPAVLLDYLIEKSSGTENLAYRSVKARASTYSVFKTVQFIEETVITSYLSGVVISSLANAVSTRVYMTFEAAQLQKKFKHAADFGVTGVYNEANAIKYSEAITEHIQAQGTQAINGFYRNGNNPVTFYLNEKTGLNVVADRAGNFIFGAKLDPKQVNDVLTKKFLW